MAQGVHPIDMTIRRRALVAVVAGFVLLVLAAIGAIVVAFTAGDAEEWATHSLKVRQTATDLFGAVEDAETAQRGYIVTHNPGFLERLANAEQRVPQLRLTLWTLVADNASQRGRLVGIGQAIDQRLSVLDRAAALERRGDHDGAVASIKTHQGQRLMDRFRTLNSEFEQNEVRLYGERQMLADRERILLISLIVLAVVCVGGLSVLVLVEARRQASHLNQQNSALLNEIAGREKVEAQLRQAQKMEALGQLTGGVAHDFNNMLAIIVGNLDMLLRRTPSDEDRRRQLIENALTGAHRAAALTKRLLAFSRLQPLDPAPTDVNKCVADMSEMLRRTLGEHVAIETVLAGGLWRAFVDCPQLESAILNLAVNGRDAMTKGGRLTIETGNASLDGAYAACNLDVTPGQYVLVAVTDTGSGMSAEVMHKAFDPFFTTKRAGEGTGLGLSQVHGFLKQSGGHVALYSEPGVGTTVKLYLPRDTSGAAPKEVQPVLATASIEGRFSVLVAEDDPGVRGFTVSALRELGFGVVEADNASVALERLAQNPQVNLLLTDVVMPVTTGRELVDAALLLRPDLKVIYMTGYTKNAIVHNGVLDVGTRLLTKPFTLAELDRELRAALREG